VVGRGEWQWSALGYLQVRSFYNSFAAVSAGRAAATRTSEQYNVPSTGLGARVELRPPLGRCSCGSGPTRARPAARPANFFASRTAPGTRERRAGGVTRTLGGFAEASVEQGPFILTGGGRIDRWWIEDGAFARDIARQRAAGLTDQLFPRPQRLWSRPGAAGGGVARRRGLTLPRRAGISAGGCPTPERNSNRPFRVGADAHGRQLPDLEPEGCAAARAGVRMAAGGAGATPSR
jgi:hypothetical protein